MIRELVTDTELLSTPCEKATAEDVEIAQDLRETLESMENCACLAANQIGYTKRIVAYLDSKDTIQIIFNPVLMQAMYPDKVEEYCLSLEDSTVVRRFGRAKISFEVLQDGKLVAKKKDFFDWEAQILQHMIDHCNGKLV